MNIKRLAKKNSVPIIMPEIWNKESRRIFVYREGV